MGIRIRFRDTELTDGHVVDYPEADSYDVLTDDTVVLRQERRRIGAVHRGRWDSIEILEEGMARGESSAAADHR